MSLVHAVKSMLSLERIPDPHGILVIRREHTYNISDPRRNKISLISSQALIHNQAKKQNPSYNTKMSNELCPNSFNLISTEWLRGIYTFKQPL